MEKVNYSKKMEIFNMKVFLGKINLKKLKNLYLKMVIIGLILKVEKIIQTEKESYIIKMDFFYMRVILLILNLKEMEDIII